MFTLADLQQHPNSLAQHYQNFGVANRLLFTGHSHQAWPDCSLTGQIQAWKDAAEFVDNKWQYAEAKAQEVRAGFAALLNDEDGDFALGQNTFDLVLRFLSALPLTKKPRIVTSDSEFHSLRRLLNRLGEEGLEIVKVPAQPMNTFIERLCSVIDQRTAAVCCSKVFFNTGLIVDNLRPVAEKCLALNVELLIDVYHCLNVLPFSIREENLQNAYIVGGGYKYCQLGEGNCFLRFPNNCKLRPIATGWYGEFDHLSETGTTVTAYQDGPARFAGATYDPTSHYRAVEVFDFFREQQLTPNLLRVISQHQINLLQHTFENYHLDPTMIQLDNTVTTDRRAGFITFTCADAKSLCSALDKRGVKCDFRGDILRFGPAPYLSDRQCRDAMAALQEAVINTHRSY